MQFDGPSATHHVPESADDTTVLVGPIPRIQNDGFTLATSPSVCLAAARKPSATMGSWLSTQIPGLRFL
jgi:hypothetical protein